MKWSLEKRKISSLKPNKKNARRLGKNDAMQLKRSMEKFGTCEPIVLNTDGTIIGGHQRVKTLKSMGHKEVDVYVPHEPLTDAESDELNIRLNKNVGEFDFDILANEWELDDLLDWGFMPEEFSIDVEDIEGDEEEGTVLEPTKDPKTNARDLYEMGNHRLVCGDSTMPDDVEKLLNGAEPILMVTDPPYGVEYDPAWRVKHGTGPHAVGKVQNDDQVNWALAWHLFPGSAAYVWHAGKYCAEVQKSLEEATFEVISQIIWAKQHFAMSRGDYHWKHEPCWYAVKKGHTHNWQGSRKEHTVWEIDNLNPVGGGKEEERTSHSTQKPMECMARPIRNNSAEGEGVYDPFVGSGTTLIACEQLNRNCFAMELDPAYCDLIVDRWVRYRKKKGLDAVVKKNGEPYELD